LRHESITEDCQEMAALYALGALNQHEARAFDLHVQDGCAICEAEATEFEYVVDLIGASVQPVMPADYLRDLLVARIAKDAQPIAIHRTATAEVIPFPDRAKTTAPLSPPTKTGPLRPLLPWAIAASLLIALAYSILSWRNDRIALQAAKGQYNDATVLKENADLKEKLSLESARAHELTQINSVLSSSQRKVLTLEGQAVAPSASANVYWDMQNRRWVVTADLPPAPAGKVYQLWFVKGDLKTNAGLIPSDAKGHGFTVVNVPPDIDIEAAAITLEPQGGSQQPTSEIYALTKTS
jgi:anti-sigma-K factor RskA